ncbi:MAG: MarR family winged helix-turn-helix transcriptional regulator [Eubacteriales bacterium]
MEYIPNGLLFKQIHDGLEKRANNQLRASDLTMMQVSVLIALNGSPEKQLSMKEIEHHFQVAQPTITGIISRMEKKGLVESSQDSSDKRMKRIRMTPSGEKYLAEAEINMHEAEEILMQGFTDEERTLFHSLLTRVAKNIK